MIGDNEFGVLKSGVATMNYKKIKNSSNLGEDTFYHGYTNYIYFKLKV